MRAVETSCKQRFSQYIFNWYAEQLLIKHPQEMEKYQHLFEFRLNHSEGLYSLFLSMFLVSINL